MNWLMLRGLAREKRHFGDFPSIFEGRLAGHRAFPMDLAGFGALSRQPVPWTIAGIVAEVRTRFLSERPSDGPWSIFALSLGGMVALEWAARHPEDFAGVVVANTSAGNLSSLTERFQPALWPRLPGLVFGDALSRERGILAITVSQQTDTSGIAPTWRTWFEERRPSRAAFLRQLVAAARSRLPTRVESPVLVLASRGDRVVSWRCSERIAAALGATLALHDTAGHDLSLDAPDWICDQIRGWAPFQMGDPAPTASTTAQAGAAR